MTKIYEKELTKLYYSIGEVAQIFDVNASLIRFWEKEFPTIKPKKNKKGNRLFTPKDIIQFDRIHHLVKTEGYTLDGAKKAMKEKKSTDSTKKVSDVEVGANGNDQVIERLEALKSQLLKLKSQN